MGATRARPSDNASRQSHRTRGLFFDDACGRFVRRLALNVAVSSPLEYVPLQLPCLIVTVRDNETEAPDAKDFVTDPELEYPQLTFSCAIGVSAFDGRPRLQTP